jgi:feruloyl esterase
VAHEDPNWDWRTFDLERDTALALEKGGYVEVTDPDLSAFKSRGGKLLLYHDGTTEGPRRHLTSEQRQLLLERPRSDGSSPRRLAPLVHGSGNGSLRRRTRSESVSCRHRTGKLA